jgi:hypothetical protein
VRARARARPDIAVFWDLTRAIWYNFYQDIRHHITEGGILKELVAFQT